MTSKKKLVKNALKNPEDYTPAELQYFKLWLAARKKKKTEEKEIKVYSKGA